MTTAIRPGAGNLDLDAQIGELRREQRMREQVYPRLIAARKMSQAEADLRNARLQAAIDTLMRVKDRRDDWK